jgi:hypothetical protein
MREKKSFFRDIQQKFNDKLLKFVLNVNFFFRIIENSFFKNFVNYSRRNVNILERILFNEMMKKRTNQMKNDIFLNSRSRDKSLYCVTHVNLVQSFNISRYHCVFHRLRVSISKDFYSIQISFRTAYKKEVNKDDNEHSAKL